MGNDDNPQSVRSKTPVENSDLDLSIKQLIFKRAAIKRKITCAFRDITETSSVMTSRACDSLVNRFLQDIRSFDERINDAYFQRAGSSLTLSTEFEKELDGQTEYSLQVKSRLEDLLKQPPTVQETASNCKLKLPQLKCVTFSGEGASHLEFHTFYSQFSNVIGNRSDISDSTKFSYLKTYLRGYAEKLVQHLQVDDANYPVAINLLKSEFQNKEFIVNDLIKKLLDLKITFDSNFLNTKLFINEVRCIISDLKLYEINLMENNSALTLLTGIVFTKLPSLFRQELVRKVDKDFPSFKDVLENYSAVINTLNIRQIKSSDKPKSQPSKNEFVPFTNSQKSESLSRTSDNKSSPIVQRSAVVENTAVAERKNCKFCSSTGHSMLNCRKYCTHDTRVKRCVELGLCSGCTSRQHSVKDCKPLNFKCNVCAGNSHIAALCSKYIPKIEANFCINASNNSGQTFLLPVIKVEIGFGTNKVAVNCLYDCGSQRSYLSNKVLHSINVKEQENKTSYHINTFINDGPKSLSEICLSVKLPDVAKPVSLPFFVCDSFNTVLSIDGWRIAHDNISKVHQLQSRVHSDELALDGILGVDALQYLTNCELVTCMGGVAYSFSGILVPFGNIDNFLTDSQLIEKYACPVSEEKGSEQQVDNTLLGFVLNPIKTYFDPIDSVLSDSQVDGNLDRMFSVESLGIHEDSRDVDDDHLRAFESEIEFKDGKYQVSLPWNENISNVKSNFDISKAILDRVVENLTRQNLYEKYDEVFKQQLEDNIIEEVTLDNKEDHVFIPHRPVIKMESQVTTKVRPVLNCSLKVGDSPSLNESSYPGINLLNDLLRLLIKIRSNSYLVISDIKQAFLMIKLKNPSDRNKFTILWRNKDGELKAYRYSSIVFGFVSSPFILLHVIKFHLNKYQSDSINEILLNNFYVDNLFITGNDPDSLVDTYKETSRRMADGGFLLRSWSSNCTQVNDLTLADGVAASHNDHYEKILGYRYFPSSDEISIAEISCIKNDIKTNPTKRSVLSALSSVFDPIGITLPVTVRGKILMKEIWHSKIGWDDELPLDLSSKWDKIKSDLITLPSLKFDRQAYSGETTLIIFTDASKIIYGFSCYARCQFNNSYSTNLIFSKCKVSPSKSKTLPTLELLAVFLAFKCISSVLKAMPQVNNVVICIDAQIVISWILTGKVKSKNIFAQNRVKDINSYRDQIKQEFSIDCNFKFIPTELNSADLLTHGLSSSVFQTKINFWNHGPEFLRTEPIDWPQRSLGCLSESNKIVLASITGSSNEPVFPVDRYSNINKLLRITALLLKYLNKLRKIEKSQTQLINEARVYWLKFEQKRYYSDEINFLVDNSNNDSVPKSVNNLNLFLDSEGLLRSRGRIGKTSEFDYNSCNPVLLPKQSYLTELFVWDFHTRCKHLSTAVTLSFVRTGGFWIPKGRITVKSVLSKCIICKKINTHPFQYPKPPEFNKHKVNFVTPYKYTGIDFTGHVFIKTGNTFVKMYILIFTCLNIRSIHLELLPNLTCSSFLLALTRFCNLNTIPEVIYSDNASTFLQGMGIMRNTKINDEFETYLSNNNILHYRIPLYSAWIGAFWERMIRTVKSSLYKVIGRKHMEYFAFITLLSDIQNAINSRPLTYRDNDDLSFEPLTPNSFLKLQSGRSLVFGSEAGSDLPSPTRKVLVAALESRESLFENFKQNWYSDYLMSLRETGRDLYQDSWKNKIQVNDIVLVSSPVKPRPLWLMGRVVEVLPGTDNRIRCVKLLRSDGTHGVYSINMLYPLELSVSSGEVLPEKSSQDDNSPRPRRQAAQLCLQRMKNCNE